MSILRSALFNLAFYTYTMLVALVFLPTLAMPRHAVIPVGKVWAHGSLFLARVIVGIRHEIRGEEYRALQPSIFASKHQSAWDTLIFWVALDNPLYVLKKELLHLPLFGWYLRKLGSIAIDRSAGASALKQIVAETKSALGEGRSVIIFPEGTRIKVGEASTYQPGVAALYSQASARVVPVALNSGLYWGRKAFFKKAGTILIRFLPPIEPGLKARGFMERLESAIETESNNLVHEAKG